MLSSLILYTLGYNYYGLNLAFKEQKVIIMPHTSYFEAFLASLAILASQTRNKISFLVTKTYYDKPLIGWLLRFFGGIRVDYSSNTHVVDQVVKFLKENPEKSLVLSPEGDLEAKKWRSGFFYIAKNANLPIYVGGIDFSNHDIRCNLFLKFDNYEISYEEALPQIQKIFSNSGIIPLYQHKSNPLINNIYSTAPTLISHKRKITFLFLAILTVISLKNMTSFDLKMKLVCN